MSTEDYDIHHTIRDLISGSSLRGPREIAAKAAENVPQKHLRQVLAVALVDFVRQELQRARRAATPITAAPSKGNRSAKVAAIRDGWRKTLAGQFHVGSGNWMVLADCSYDNVLFLAAERHEHARRTVAVGVMFDALAEEMQKNAVSRVGDLPEPVLAQILTVEVAA